MMPQNSFWYPHIYNVNDNCVQIKHIPKDCNSYLIFCFFISGCISAVVEKVSSVMVESSLNSSEESSKNSNQSIAVNLFKLHSMPTDSISKVTDFESD